jgi:hypothetical protein
MLDAQSPDARPMDAALDIGSDALPADASAGDPSDAAGPDMHPDATRPRRCPTPATTDPIRLLDEIRGVSLDGGPSLARGAPISEWHWALVETPVGSRAALVEFRDDPDDPTTPTARFLPDLFGRYRFELSVVDATGLRAPSDACPTAPAQVELTLEPVQQGAHVEITWVTPDDPDPQDDDSTDVDLHLLHPRGRSWGQAPLDCFHGNSSPDWGEPGPAGNPSLEIDSNDGGPERIHLRLLEETAAAPYLVGVDYFRSGTQAGDLGASDVRLRIFIDGALTLDAVQTLQTRGAWWTGAEIHWPARVVERRNLYEATPEARE